MWLRLCLGRRSSARAMPFCQLCFLDCHEFLCTNEEQFFKVSVVIAGQQNPGSMVNSGFRVSKVNGPWSSLMNKLIVLFVPSTDRTCRMTSAAGKAQQQRILPIAGYKVLAGTVLARKSNSVTSAVGIKDLSLQRPSDP